MTYAVVFVSRTGNTRRLAEAIPPALGREACCYFGPPSDEALRADWIFAGFWTNRGDCGDEMAAFLARVTTQRVFLFGTAGFGGDAKYFADILGRVREKLPAAARCCGTFMCQGEMPPAVRTRYEAMEDGPQKAQSLRNFDMALGHPDEADLQALACAAAQAWQKAGQDG